MVYDLLKERKTCLSLIGLGYVGLPIAVAFAERGVNVIGFDINEQKIKQYKAGFDPTNEIGSDRLSAILNPEATTADKGSVLFTSQAEDLKKARFHIVAVPTPVNPDHTPNLNPVVNASEILGNVIKRGDIVVFESTVYPGVTEEICKPILEKFSGLSCGVDFKIGYSPERINPGDQEHRLENIVKIVSGIDEDALDMIANVYGIVVDAGVFRASSIKVAEAAKVIENAQRDINIAFVNELALIFDKMGVDTHEVLSAAATKWNFLKFSPGLVGGHCIGVDPYYLTYKAEQLGYSSQVILAGRRINDGMGKYIAEKTVKNLIRAGTNVNGARVVILGLTFKENCPDLRNSKVYDIIQELEEYSIKVLVCDPEVDPEEAKREYGIELVQPEKIKDADAVILAVAHDAYKNLTMDQIKRLFKSEHLAADQKKCVVIDIKSMMEKSEFEKEFRYWRL